MNQALLTAASGMQLQQKNLDNIANNIANSSTVGFKRARLEFQDILYQNLRTPGAAATSSTTVPVGLQLGIGAQTVSSEKLFAQGTSQETDNPLDLVIQGNGFFQLRQANGNIVYTRAGAFNMNQQGQVTDANGNLLDPAITIPTNATSISIGQDGTVSVTVPGQNTSQNVGQIQLATFANPGGLSAIGQNLFQETTASGQPITGSPTTNGLGSLSQGYLEGSNVSVVDELVNMIEAQQAFETNSKVITAANQMLTAVNQVIS